MAEIANLTVLDGGFSPDERCVILSESFCHAALENPDDLVDSVRKALAAMALSGQRICYLDVEA